METTTDRPLVNVPLVKWYVIMGFTFFAVSLLAGLLYAFQFLQMYPFSDFEYLSPGRLRMVHTNAAAFGFLFNCLVGYAFWAVPRLTGKPILSDKLGWICWAGLQVGVLAAAAGILLGQAQAVEWGETPTWIDPIVVLVVGATFINLGYPIATAKTSRLYVTLWYFVAAFIWTALTYIMGNFFPQYWVPGSAGAAMVGLYIHDLVGLFVTPFGWGLMYFFVPILIKKPIWSHALSHIGFWGLAFFYPLQGIHHFLYSPIPMYLQYGAVVSTMALEIVVMTVVINFFGSLWGRGDYLRHSLPTRWFYTGMVLYFTTCFQCAMQVTLTFQKIIHFTDWVVGHAHLVMVGVFGFWIFGITIHLWPKLVNRTSWWSDRLNSYHYWTTTIALVVMFLDLTLAGVVQGFSWAGLEIWEHSLISSFPFWYVRMLAGVAIVTGFVLFVFNMYMTARQPAGEARLAQTATAAV